MLYLDNAATTHQKPIEVYMDLLLQSMFFSANAGRGGHTLSLKSVKKIQDTADELAELFNIEQSNQIAFTANATHGLNLAIRGIAEDSHIIVTSMDHNSVLRPAFNFCKYKIVQADKYGMVSPENIEDAITPETKLIVCTHVSNVCGNIQPIEKIGEIAKKHNIPFLVDASQSAGVVDIDVKKQHIDLLAMSGHKGLLGPLGTGVLYVSEALSLKPVLVGGTGSQSESLSQPDFMPDILHSGTLNAPAISALGVAIRKIKKITTKSILEHEQYLAWKLITELEKMDNIQIYGNKNITLKNGTVCFNIDGMESGEVAEILNDKHRIAVRGGWHCAYLAHKTLGTDKSGAVRVSFGIFNKEKDVKRLVNAIKKISYTKI